jgi:hypothetical protein
MAELATLQVIENGYRNVVIKGVLISDGSGVTLQKIYDAESTGIFGVNKAGQVFYPGVYTKIIGLDFDVQDQKFAMYWEATANVPIFAFGSSPEDFRWKGIGGIPAPIGEAGLTGSILLSTLSPMVDATLTFILSLRKDVPQS